MKASLADARVEYDRLTNAVERTESKYNLFAAGLGDNDSAVIALKANLDALKNEQEDAAKAVKLLEGQLQSNSKTLQNNADAVSRAKTKANAQLFATAVAKYTEAQELTREMLLDLIEKIVVHEATGIRSANRAQEVEIHFRFIGQLPDNTLKSTLP